MNNHEIIIDKKHRIRVLKDCFELLEPCKVTKETPTGWRGESWHVDLVHAVRSVTQKRMSGHPGTSTLDDFIKEYRSIHSALMKHCALYSEK